MIKSPRFISLLVAVAAAVFVSPLAHGQNSILQLMNNGMTVTIGDNSASDSNPTTGVTTYIGPVGDFATNVSTGTSKPAVGSATSPQLVLASLNITNISSSPETLFILFSDNNFGPVMGTPQAALSVTQLGSSPASPPNGAVDYKVYLDAGNTRLAQTTLLTAIGPVTVNGTNVGAFGSFSFPFALTQVLKITLNAGGTFIGSAAFNITPTAVPEVSGVVTGVLAALVIGIGLSRRWLTKARLRRSAA